MCRAFWLLMTVILVLFTDSAFAQSGIHQFSETLSPPESDYSVAYLSQIFGTVGNVLQGTSGQILGKMFAIFNKGVLVVATLWLGYSVSTMAVRAAGEGSFMGANRNVHWTLLRIAMGFAFIIPSSTTGYSLLQDIFMKIVVQGVGLADQTWDTALKYLEYGGQLYIPPKALNNDTNIVASTILCAANQQATNCQPIPASPPTSAPTSPPSQPYAPVTQIFQDEVCMIKSNKSWAKAWWTGQPGNSNKTAPVFDFHPIYDELNGKVYFPGVGNADTVSAQDLENGTATAGCGTATSYYMEHPYMEHPSPSLSIAQQEGQAWAMKNYSFSALKQMVLSELPAAHLYVDYHGSANPDDSLNAQKNAAKAIFSAILAYGNLITPYQHMLSMDQAATGANAVHTYNQGQEAAGNYSGVESYTNSENNSMSTISNIAAIPQARAEGWIMAGSFYWNVEQMNQSASTISISALLPTTTGPGMNAYNRNYLDLYYAAYTASFLYAGEVKTLWEAYIGAQQNNVQVDSAGHATSSNAGFASTMIGSSAEALSSTAGDFGLKSSHYNPIIVLMSEGETLLSVVVGMWMSAIILSTLFGAFAGICSADLPNKTIFTSALTWVKSILMMITSVLLLPGAILTYYVPMYPYAVFTFAAVGWILMVIEGMAAVPLLALGVTHPEGHDFLGKAEQMLMLFLGIFVRPALMIIGLIAAMIVSFVAFHMLITGFGTVLTSILSSMGQGTQGLLGMISFGMVMLIFGMITMELIEQCYKLIYQLPNYMSKWIGGPQMGEEYGQMAGAVKGAVSSGASAGGESMRAATDSAGALPEAIGAAGAAAARRGGAAGGGGVGGQATPGGGGPAPGGGGSSQ